MADLAPRRLHRWPAGRRHEGRGGQGRGDCGGHAQQLHPAAVQQPRQRRDPQAHHGARDLAGHRGQGGCGCARGTAACALQGTAAGRQPRAAVGSQGARRACHLHARSLSRRLCPPRRIHTPADAPPAPLAHRSTSLSAAWAPAAPSPAPASSSSPRQATFLSNVLACLPAAWRPRPLLPLLLPCSCLLSPCSHPAAPRHACPSSHPALSSRPHSRPPAEAGREGGGRGAHGVAGAERRQPRPPQDPGHRRRLCAGRAQHKGLRRGGEGASQRGGLGLGLRRWAEVCRAGAEDGAAAGSRFACILFQGLPEPLLFP